MKQVTLTHFSLCSVLLGILLTQAVLAAPEDDFVTTWKTDNPGPSNNTTIRIPMIGGPYAVDWDNDGTFDEFAISGTAIHHYEVAGTYTIRISGSYDSIRFNYDGDKAKIVSLDQWGTNTWTSMNAAFEGAFNLQVSATDAPDLSAVTDISYMFAQADLANPDTSGWDTSTVTNMSYMFRYATSANPDTSGWDTSAVTDMSRMFFYAKSATPDTSGWDTSAVTNMSHIFAEASIANPNTSGWDTSAVTDMGAMFWLTNLADPDTSGWDTSAVTEMSGIFSDAKSASPDTSAWDTSAVTRMWRMFANATLANPDTSAWDTSAVTDMGSMFGGATLANPDTSGWDTAAVTNMSGLFSSAISANSDISGWDTSAVTDMSFMFSGNTPVSPERGKWDTSAVTNMRLLFSGNTLANPDTSIWNTSAVTNMSSMFEDATSANPDTSHWDTSAVRDMSYMFLGATVANPDVSGWDTSALVHIKWMFYHAISANPDVSGWDTSGVTNMRHLFEGATLANPDVGGWDTSSVSNMRRMFFGATSFDQDIGSWDVSALYVTTLMFEGVTLSTTNYESLLIGWSTLDLRPDRYLNVRNSTYCSAAAKAAKEHMISTFSWTIVDGGQVCPPDQPTGIKATDGDFLSLVRVTFNPVADATVYRVFRCLDMGQTCGSPIGYPTTGSFDDRNAVPGTVYYYRVRACIENICGKFSAANTGFSSIQLPPPTGIKATDGTILDRVNISWNGVEGASLYRVFRCLDKGQTCGSPIGFPNGTSFDDTGAPPNTVYYYRVKACELQHCSKFSVANAGHNNLSSITEDNKVTAFMVPDQEVPIPTLSNPGRWLLMLIMLGFGMILVNRQNVTGAS